MGQAAPHTSNNRAPAAAVLAAATGSEPTFSAEQQYMLLDPATRWPLGGDCQDNQTVCKMANEMMLTSISAHSSTGNHSLAFHWQAGMYSPDQLLKSIHPLQAGRGSSRQTAKMRCRRNGRRRWRSRPSPPPTAMSGTPMCWDGMSARRTCAPVCMRESLSQVGASEANEKQLTGTACLVASPIGAWAPAQRSTHSASTSNHAMSWCPAGLAERRAARPNGSRWPFSSLCRPGQSQLHLPQPHSTRPLFPDFCMRNMLMYPYFTLCGCAAEPLAGW